MTGRRKHGRFGARFAALVLAAVLALAPVLTAASVGEAGDGSVSSSAEAPPASEQAAPPAPESDSPAQSEAQASSVLQEEAPDGSEAAPAASTEQAAPSEADAEASEAPQPAAPGSAAQTPASAPDSSVPPGDDDGPKAAAALPSIVLPYDISFKIMVFEGLGEGVLGSDAFSVINSGEVPVTVSVNTATLLIDGAGVYTVLTADAFTGDESAIFAQLVCEDTHGEATATLQAYPVEGIYTYRLAPGQAGRFYFQGKVSEHGAKWGDAQVSVLLDFSFEEDPDAPPAA
ncbi:MAG: hypothetical protein AB7V55_00280 [Oscillospiraceae bacterium]